MRAEKRLISLNFVYNDLVSLCAFLNLPEKHLQNVASEQALSDTRRIRSDARVSPWCDKGDLELGESAGLHGDTHHQPSNKQETYADHQEVFANWC